jgi:hypothetical protein
MKVFRIFAQVFAARTNQGTVNRCALDIFRVAANGVSSYTRVPPIEVIAALRRLFTEIPIL